MFLQSLNTDARELFLDLCIHAAMANKVLAVEEKKAIDDFCFELCIDSPRYEASKSLDEVLQELGKMCSRSEINIIFIEILALLMTDEEFDADEKSFVKAMQDALGVSDEKVDRMLEKLCEMHKATIELAALI